MKEDIEEICQAAFEGRIEDLKKYLNSNLDINASGRNWTILQSAIENENIECVKLIIEKGANVEFRGGSNLTPLEHSIDTSIQSNINTGGKEGEESIKIIKLLLEAGAEPELGLRIANSYGSTKIKTLLLNFMANNK
jgi:ankyrin repeat protein